MAFASPGQTAVAANLRQRLHSGETSYGVLLCTGSPVVAEIVSACGYDTVVIDADHSPIDGLTAVHILQALGGAGSTGIIRVPENSSYHIKKALDLGPAGIIIPSIDSADAAKQAIASCKYPPAGIRGYSSPTVRASMYGLQHDYSRRIEDFPLIIAQIESELAVGRISEIAAVEGIDCIMISPDDVATSIGKFPDQEHEEVQRLVRRAEETVLACGKLLGSFSPNANPLGTPEMFMRGYNIVVGSSDVALLRDNARSDVVRVRGIAARPGAAGVYQGLTAENGKVSGTHQPLIMGRMAHGVGGGALGTPGLAMHGVGIQAGAGPIGAGGHAVLLPAMQHQTGVAAGGQAGMGMQFNVSRRGGRGTPKRCSQCHMPLKEGHREDCSAWEKKQKMRMRYQESLEAQNQPQTQTQASSQGLPQGQSEPTSQAVALVSAAGAPGASAAVAPGVAPGVAAAVAAGVAAGVGAEAAGGASGGEGMEAPGPVGMAGPVVHEEERDEDEGMEEEEEGAKEGGGGEKEA